MGLFTIETGINTPLGGVNHTFFSNVTSPRSDNLFFDPLPFEWLKTYETAPQLLVTVGDYPAVCHNLSCDFKYTVPEGEVTSYTYSQANNRTLVLNGTQLPENSTLVRRVDFAHSPCDLVSLDHYSSNGTLLNLTDLELQKAQRANASAAAANTTCNCTCTATNGTNSTFQSTAANCTSTTNCSSACTPEPLPTPSYQLLTCRLRYEPTCGSHLPILTSIHGRVNNSASLANETISCAASAV